MMLSSDESQKLCRNLKESGETLQMRASKEAITFGVQGGICTGTRMLAVILPQDRTVEQIVDGPVPQVREQIGELNQLIPQVRVFESIDEQIVDVPCLRSENSVLKS